MLIINENKTIFTQEIPPSFSLKGFELTRFQTLWSWKGRTQPTSRLGRIRLTHLKVQTTGLWIQLEDLHHRTWEASIISGQKILGSQQQLNQFHLFCGPSSLWQSTFAPPGNLVSDTSPNRVIVGNKKSNIYTCKTIIKSCPECIIYQGVSRTTKNHRLPKFCSSV